MVTALRAHYRAYAAGIDDAAFIVALQRALPEAFAGEFRGVGAFTDADGPSGNWAFGHAATWLWLTALRGARARSRGRPAVRPGHEDAVARFCAFLEEQAAGGDAEAARYAAIGVRLLDVRGAGSFVGPLARAAAEREDRESERAAAVVDAGDEEDEDEDEDEHGERVRVAHLAVPARPSSRRRAIAFWRSVARSRLGRG